MVSRLSGLNRALIPAIPTWFSRSENGYNMNMISNRKYVNALIKEPIAGLAVLVHTGRGNFLDEFEKKQYLKDIVEICHDKGKIVITGVSCLGDAMLAKNTGVDTVLIFPNRNQLDGLHDPERKTKICEYHDEIMTIHDSGILFLLYEETSVGILYSKDELSQLLDIKGIEGVKFALLSNFEQYEDLLWHISENHRETAIFTGEDRMFGESLEKSRILP
ncbi:MAG: dihydrodipicolinate synthase family protein [Candidatus Hodarchaeota archaeon]